MFYICWTMVNALVSYTLSDDTLVWLRKDLFTEKCALRIANSSNLDSYLPAHHSFSVCTKIKALARMQRLQAGLSFYCLCMVTFPVFSTIFSKGQNFGDFLFAYLKDKVFPKRVYSYRKEFAHMGA